MQRTTAKKKHRQARKPRTEPVRGRGRHPESRPGGRSDTHRNILLGVKDQVSKDYIGIVAAGVAFYAFLALFPALAALVSIYGLAIDPQTAQQNLSQLTEALPQPAAALVGGQLQRIAAGESSALGWGLVGSILLALWSANKGTKALFQGIHIAYNERDTRGILLQNALSLLFTLGGVMVVIISIAMIVVVPAVLSTLELPAAVTPAIRYVRWPIMAGIIFAALTIIYRYAPIRSSARDRWISWGAGTATILWLIASAGFSFYVSRFASYNKTYGSLAAVVILLLWFMISSFVVLLGAEINTELETRRKGFHQA